MSTGTQPTPDGSIDDVAPVRVRRLRCGRCDPLSAIVAAPCGCRLEYYMRCLRTTSESTRVISPAAMMSCMASRAVIRRAKGDSGKMA